MEGDAVTAERGVKRERSESNRSELGERRCVVCVGGEKRSRIWWRDEDEYECMMIFI